MKELRLLLLLALGLVASQPLAADNCLYECQGSTCSDFGNKSSFCSDLRATCQARCSGRRWWGAIAYSAKDKKFGWSVDWNTENAAKQEALRRCSKQGAACKVIAAFENECGAVAADGNIVTWGTAYLSAKAQQRALLECRKAGGKNCAVEVWACSTYMK
jgi:hypothetical protein